MFNCFHNGNNPNKYTFTDCYIPIRVNVQKDTPPPVMIHQDGKRYLEPEGTDGAIYLKKNENVILFCSDGFTFSKEFRSLNATCLGNNQYEIQQTQQTHSLFEIICNSLPRHEVRRSGNCLGRNNTAIGIKVLIGFKIDDQTFLPLMEVCHDEHQHRTHYSRYTLKPANYISQIDTERPAFVKGGFYDKLPVNDLYSKDGQWDTFQQLLGPEMSKKYVLSSNQLYLSRGHLMAKVDLIFGDLQRATFYYINAAPQW